MPWNRLVLPVAMVVVAITASNSVIATAQTSSSATPVAPGMLANLLAPATYPPYGTELVAGCLWATWVKNCSNLNVYSNGGSFGNVGCGAPNGCTYGQEFQCDELAQRYAAYAWGEPDTWYGYGGQDGSAASMWLAGPALPHPLMQLPNGGGVPPEAGDLLIFGPGYIGSYFDAPGHVAVVSAVGSNYVDIVEQNGTASGTDVFTLSGSTIVQPAGYTPLIGWLRPQSWAGPINLTTLWGSGTTADMPDALDSGTQQLVFWRGTDNHLYESWNTAGVGWTGPVDYTSQLGGTAILASSPDVALTPTGQQLVFWRGTDNHLWEAWFTPNIGWSGPVDYTTRLGSTALLGSAPTITLTPSGQQLAFWQGTGNHLWEAWFTPGIGWSGPTDYTAMLGNTGLLQSPPRIVLTPTGQQLAFWQGADNHLWEAWFTPGLGWSGPVDYTTRLGSTALLAAEPSVGLTSSGQQLAYWEGTDNHLYEAWFTPGIGWLGPTDYTNQLGDGTSGGGTGGSGGGGTGGSVTPPPALVAAAPQLMLAPGGQQQVFWRGSNNHLWEAVYNPGLGWDGPNDVSAQTLNAPAAADLAAAPDGYEDGAVTRLVWQGTANTLWEAFEG